MNGVHPLKDGYGLPHSQGPYVQIKAEREGFLKALFRKDQS